MLELAKLAKMKNEMSACLHFFDCMKGLQSFVIITIMSLTTIAAVG